MLHPQKSKEMNSRSTFLHRLVHDLQYAWGLLRARTRMGYWAKAPPCGAKMGPLNDGIPSRLFRLLGIRLELAIYLRFRTCTTFGGTHTRPRSSRLLLRIMPDCQIGRFSLTLSPVTSA
jgi:hypothetical protein